MSDTAQHTAVRRSALAGELLGPQRRRLALWLAILIPALGVSIVLTIGIGPAQIAPTTVWSILAERLGLPAIGEWSRAEATIVSGLRVPRILLGVAVGAGLAICGAALQGLVRNMLADPYILGISGGASTGAAAAILFGFAAQLGQQALPLSAFCGALLASGLVFVLAPAGGQLSSLRVLLAGIAVGYALSACTSLLIFASDDAAGSRSVMFWLLGSLSLARFDGLLLAVGLAVAATLAALMLVAGRLDALALGDGTARGLGVSPAATRVAVLVLVSLCTGAVVAAAGAIGFIGLVVPHIARRLVGSAHLRLLPIAALLGAILLIWADAGARTVMAPRELPVGIITALIGTPILFLLIRRMRAAIR